MGSEFETLQLTRSGHVLEIRLDRAEARNAVSHVMHDELTKAFAALRDEPDIRAVVLASSGRVFCAGGDFGLILADRANPPSRRAMADNARALFTAICDCPLPIVVALQGDAVGLGATIVLGGDAIVAARTARISDPHVVIGLVAGDGGCVLWPQAIGLIRAKRYLLTGDRVDAELAHAMGLVTDLVDTPEEVAIEAHALAERIAALPPSAVQLTKRALNQGLRHRMEEVFEQAIAYEIETFFSDDVGEAIAAMQEKRAPNYTGN